MSLPTNEAQLGINRAGQLGAATQIAVVSSWLHTQPKNKGKPEKANLYHWSGPVVENEK